MNQKKKTTQQLNFSVPIGLFMKFEALWVREKTKRLGDKIKKPDLLIEIIRKGLEHWPK